MTALVGGANTPLANVEGLGEALIEKLSAAGITTVEGLADMTPEQLEEIPGVGPKTVEKISIAVNNYFSSLEAGENPAAEEAALETGEALELDAQAEQQTLVPGAGNAEADNQYQEALDSGQALEAAAEAGVENAPPADVAEVHTHGDLANLAPEETVEPEIPEPEEQAEGTEPGEKEQI
jgi:N utilization substance protein A